MWWLLHDFLRKHLINLQYSEAKEHSRSPVCKREKAKSTRTFDGAPRRCWCLLAWRWSWGTGWRGSEGTSSLRSSLARTGLPCQGECPPPALPQLETKTDESLFTLFLYALFFIKLWLSYHRLVFCQGGWPQSAAGLHMTSWGVWTWAPHCQLLGRIYRNMAGLEWASQHPWRSFEAGRWSSYGKALKAHQKPEALL